MFFFVFQTYDVLDHVMIRTSRSAAIAMLRVVMGTIDVAAWYFM